MFKTLKEIKAHKEQITSKGLQTAVIYFKSPILNAVEERHIYADNIIELRAWLNDTTTLYLKNNICYIAYINNHIEQTNGDITTNFLGLEDYDV